MTENEGNKNHHKIFLRKTNITSNQETETLNITNYRYLETWNTNILAFTGSQTIVGHINTMNILNGHKIIKILEEIGRRKK